MRPRLVLVTTALALLLAGCGSDESDVSDAISESIRESNGAVLEISESQSACFGDGVVDGVGVSSLRETGILTDDMTIAADLESVTLQDEDADVWVDTLDKCVGDGSAFVGGQADSAEGMAACLKAAPELLLLAGDFCGADSAASAAISDSIVDSSDQTFDLSEDQADCIGDGMVEDIGTERLVEYGLLTEDLGPAEGLDAVSMSEGDADAAATVMQDCADIKEVFTSAMGSDIPEEAATCIDENLTDEVLHDFLVAVFMNDQEGGTQNLMTALQECMQA